MEQSLKSKERLTFTEWLRVTFKDVLNWGAGGLHKLGVHPNTLTITGVLGTAVGAYFVSQGDFSLGGLLMMLMGPVDALDGALARLRGEPEVYGAFVDSVSDRYSELLVFLGLLWYYASQANLAGSILVFLAACGSVMVSYVRARAQSLGFDAKVGFLSRVERFLIIGPSLLFRIPIVGVAIVAAGANLTAFQRMLHVRRQARGL